MLLVLREWRDWGYVDLYWFLLVWMNGFFFVIINNQKFVIVKEVDYELINWYGKDYW